MLLSSNLLVLASSLLSLTSATSLEPRHDKVVTTFTFEIHSLDNFWVPSEHIEVSFVLPLRRKAGAQPVALRYLASLRNGKQTNGVFGQEEIDVTDTGMLPSSLPNPTPFPSHSPTSSPLS